jgi:hypothetical protein
MNFESIKKEKLREIKAHSDNGEIECANNSERELSFFKLLDVSFKEDADYNPNIDGKTPDFRIISSNVIGEIFSINLKNQIKTDVTNRFLRGEVAIYCVPDRKKQIQDTLDEKIYKYKDIQREGFVIVCLGAFDNPQDEYNLATIAPHIKKKVEDKEIDCFYFFDENIPIGFVGRNVLGFKCDDCTDLKMRRFCISKSSKENEVDLYVNLPSK